ncbi:MAG TPA: cobyric acid synthase, partial [Paenibacillaceae bacterium]|nr:cobyric acid synthase [Paenibacillaceae bacterium]
MEDSMQIGPYLHGIFHNRNFTRSWLNEVRQEKGVPVVDEAVLTEKERREQAYAALGKIVRENLDMEKVYDIMGLTRK